MLVQPKIYSNSKKQKKIKIRIDFHYSLTIAANGANICLQCAHSNYFVFASICLLLNVGNCSLFSIYLICSFIGMHVINVSITLLDRNDFCLILLFILVVDARDAVFFWLVGFV